MKKLVLGTLILATVITSCEKNKTMSDNSNLTIDIRGLEDLGSSYVYEGWLMVNGNPISSGRFSVNASGQLSQTSFAIPTATLEAAATFVLTIEPAVADDPAPTKIRLLAGDFSGNSGTMSVSHAAALANNFSMATGKYILATPTDTDDTNEYSGVWFLDNSSGTPTKGLELPALPEGWIYEGWAVIGGMPISTGTFSNGSMADSNASTSMFKGTANDGPAYPGEDFLRNAPSGLTFPTSLLNQRIVVSIEPVPDNSTAPFLLKPLVHTVPMGAQAHRVLTMDKNLTSLPTGTFSR